MCLHVRTLLRCRALEWHQGVAPYMDESSLSPPLFPPLTPPPLSVGPLYSLIVQYAAECGLDVSVGWAWILCSSWGSWRLGGLYSAWWPRIREKTHRLIKCGVDIRVPSY